MKNVARTGSLLFSTILAFQGLVAYPAAAECRAEPGGQASSPQGQPGAAAPLGSCCDDSTLSIANNGGEGWVVENVDKKQGKLTGLDEGDKIAAGSSVSAVASSASGTLGDASGTVTITSGKDRFNLSYRFAAATQFGGCPCTPKVTTTPLKSGSWTADAVPKTGQHNGEARLKWDLSN